MNFLAHLNLSYPSAELLTGNYICDFITKHQEKEVHDAFHDGIKMHRWIDNYSNNHPDIFQINEYFHPYIHKYAPVGTDIVCDYLLYKNWETHNFSSFDFFQENCYRKLYENIELMPVGIRERCKSMIAHQWLMQYTNLEGLEYVFNRMNTIAKFPVDFRKILPAIETNETQLRMYFNNFYNECKSEVAKLFNPQNEMRM